jgi:hypothetical protein
LGHLQRKALVSLNAMLRKPNEAGIWDTIRASLEREIDWRWRPSARKRKSRSDKGKEGVVLSGSPGLWLEEQQEGPTENLPYLRSTDTPCTRRKTHITKVVGKVGIDFLLNTHGSSLLLNANTRRSLRTLIRSLDTY